MTVRSLYANPVCVIKINDNMKLRPLSLQEHQEILYDLLYTLDDFCKENNIRYFLGYGTLLGAVRHKGIIPWDDDADIMMEREEYERFQRLIISNPPEGYKAYSILNTSSYYYPFIKFGKESTLLIEPFKYVPQKGIGINIDVFPIDGCEGKTREEAQKYASRFFPVYFSMLNKRFSAKKWSDLSSLKERLHYIAHFVLHFEEKIPFLQKTFFLRLYKKAAKLSVKDANYYSCISWSFNGYKNVHSTSYLTHIIRVPFGSRNLPIPSDYDKILREEYGDYMIPPIDKKSTHQHGDTFIIENIN